MRGWFSGREIWARQLQGSYNGELLRRIYVDKGTWDLIIASEVEKLSHRALQVEQEAFGSMESRVAGLRQGKSG